MATITKAKIDEARFRELVRSGQSNREIADALWVSENTVRRLRTSLDLGNSEHVTRWDKEGQKQPVEDTVAAMERVQLLADLFGWLANGTLAEEQIVDELGCTEAELQEAKAELTRILRGKPYSLWLAWSQEKGQE